MTATIPRAGHLKDPFGKPLLCGPIACVPIRSMIGTPNSFNAEAAKRAAGIAREFQIAATTMSPSKRRGWWARLWARIA